MKTPKKILASNHNAQSHEQVVLSWVAPEYIHQPKTVQWYIVATLAILVLCLWAFFTNSWSMLLALAVFAGVYIYLHHYHPPKNIEIKITDLGIWVGEIFYPYSHIQAFWIHYQHGLKTLNLRVHKQFFHDVVIQLGNQNPAGVRHTLVSQIPEWEGKSERLGEMILRLLKL